MPLDPSISLQVKPPVIATPDVSKTFLTLSQMKYLNSETQRTAVQAQAAQEDAARKQTAFGEHGAASAYLSSLGQAPPGPSGPAPGGPPFDEATLAALPQGGSTPAPGSPPAPRGAVDLLHPTVQAGMRAIAPHVAEDVIKGLYERKDQEAKIKTQQLAALNTTLETGARVMGGARDEPSYQLALGVLKELKADVSLFPPHWDPERGPALAKAFAESTRTQQQRIEEAQKDLELTTAKQQADTGRITAQTGRIEATKPIPAGTGYFQHPDGTWTPMAPQASAPGTVRSPQGQGVHDTLSQKFETGSQDFKASTAAYNEVVPALKQGTNTGDLVALRAFSKLSLPGQAVRGAGSNAPMGNILEQVEGEISRLVTDKGATIAPALRQKLLDTAKVLHAQQIDTHLQFRDQIRTEASGQLGPAAALEVAPNRLTTLGSGNPDKVLTQAQFQEILTHERAKGKTRGEVYLDLTEKGYSVRGGPQ